MLNLNGIKLNVSKIARELVYGSRPRIPSDKLVAYKEMQEYVDSQIAIAFGRFIHGLDNHGRFNKFTKTYQSNNGSFYTIVANPDLIIPPLIEEEKCTFNSKVRDRVGEMQLQLEGFVSGTHLGILKIKHLSSNTTSRKVVRIDYSLVRDLIETYLSQTLLHYM